MHLLQCGGGILLVINTDRRLLYAAVQLSDVVVEQHGARLVGVQSVELVRAVLSGADRDRLATTGVVVQEVGHIVDLRMSSTVAQ